MWSMVFVCLSVSHSVSRITAHKRVYGCWPNMVGMAKGWSSRFWCWSKSVCDGFWIPFRYDCGIRDFRRFLSVSHSHWPIFTWWNDCQGLLALYTVGSACAQWKIGGGYFYLYSVFWYLHCILPEMFFDGSWWKWRGEEASGRGRE